MMTKQSGFTLLELMIATAVVGILAAVAYPAYVDQIRKSKRSEAQAALMNISARQQQMLLDTRSYASTLNALNISLSDSVQKAYSVSLTLGTTAVPSFTVTAAPLGAQAKDKCGTLSMDQSGTRSPATCW